MSEIIESSPHFKYQKPVTAMNSTVLIGLDCEMSGSRPSLHFMPSLTAVVSNTVARKRLATIKVLFSKPADKTWDERCYNELWLNPLNNLSAELDRLERGEGKSVVEGTLELIVFIERAVLEHAGGDYHRIQFTTDSSTDITWINHYLDLADHEPLTTFWNRPATPDQPAISSYRDVLNTTSYALGASRCGVDEVTRAHLNNEPVSEYWTLWRQPRSTPESRPSATHAHSHARECSSRGQSAGATCAPSTTLHGARNAWWVI
jgi:hypothetical protein